jgi:activator of HSP90 ATPase
MKNEFTLSAILNVKPEKAYKAWLNSKEHSSFTGSPAKINPKAGGAFTAWDGYISGKTMELLPFKRILQNWRTTEFPDTSPDSRLEITFDEVDNGTKLTLKHSNIPEGQADEYKKGWKEFYFKPMKKYFSL